MAEAKQCRWCGQRPEWPGVNARSERCPCSCHPTNTEATPTSDAVLGLLETWVPNV